ncbi:MAG TPA: CocE/NonD family hydrolase [Solirubrobacteraceae bacterium]|nr:CocE/NonD family hydrolase [Solirubrobacteraceae bacterium]
MRVLVAALVALLLAPAAAAAAPTVQQLRVPMRDGVELAVDLVLPEGLAPGARVPVILTLTPYHELYKGLGDVQGMDGYRFVADGYAFALADVRGTYESGGCWDYGGLRERQDGHDLVEWLGTQPWSNGRVGMMGVSYDGTTANAAAVERPPHLATIVPISAISRWYGYAYSQGARHTYSGESADIDPPGDTPADFMLAYGFLPPPEPGGAAAAAQIAQRWSPCDRMAQTEHGYDTEPDYDDFWVQRDYLRFADRVDVPVLVAHGLEDYNVKTWEGTQWFEALRGPKKLVIGQWPHALPTLPEWNDLLDRWFARWLKGEPNGVEDEPAVLVESTDDEWHARSRWTGNGRLRAALGSGDVEIVDDGLLTESEMLRGACGPRCVRLRVPGLGGTWIQGRPRLTLRMTSDQPSTHVVAVLLDVAPNGSAQVISRGFMNARYREGLEQGRDLPVGEPVALPLELIDKDHRVPDDHEVELVLASSSTTWVLSDERRATNVFHLGESALELPVEGPEPPAPPRPPAAAAPAPPPTVSGRRCARRKTIKLPRRARAVRVRVGGRKVRPRVRGRKLRVSIPRTRTGRVVVRVTLRVRGDRRTIVRRVRSCRR